MVIDLDRCTGCQACVVACNAENNIPVVTESEAAYGRWLNWIHIERYWEGEYPNVKAKFMLLAYSSAFIYKNLENSGIIRFVTRNRNNFV